MAVEPYLVGQLGGGPRDLADKGVTASTRTTGDATDPLASAKQGAEEGAGGSGGSHRN